MRKNVEQEWFDHIYTETLPVVRRCIYSFLKLYPDLKGEADDLIQETYIRLYDNRGKLQNHPEIVKWLVRASRYLVMNRLRVRKTQYKHTIICSGDEGYFENITEDSYVTIDEIFVNEDQEKLKKIADCIGRDKLELLSEYYIDRIPLEVLAEREHTTPNALKMRISRLRKKCLNLFITVFVIEALLLKGYIHIGDEGHGNHYTEKVLFGSRCTETVDGGDK